MQNTRYTENTRKHNRLLRENKENLYNQQAQQMSLYMCNDKENKMVTLTHIEVQIFAIAVK